MQARFVGRNCAKVCVSCFVASLIACESSDRRQTDAGALANERMRVLAGGAIVSPWASSPDEETVVAPSHLVDEIPARNADGTVNAVVEIPAGTTAKFEVEPDSGELKWEYREGVPRVVPFLGYPGNYGLIPSTLLPKSEGGDGYPLDVLVIGPAMGRAEVSRVRVIGVLRLLDEGEIDDKLIGVPLETTLPSPFTALHDIADLERDYPTVLEILKLWFLGYDGPGVTEFRGWGGPGEAMELLRQAEAAYKRGEGAATTHH